MKGGWISVIVLTLLLSACSAGPGLTSLLDENPEALMTVNLLSGERAQNFLRSVEGFCPGLSEENVYRVQLVDNEKALTKVLNSAGSVLCEIDTKDPEFAEKSVALTINDQAVYVSEINNALQTVPQEARAEAIGEVINALINNKLLMQEVTTKDIAVTEEEITAALESVELPANADVANIRSITRDQLKLQKLVNEVMADVDSVVTEEETLAYYNDNIDQMVVSAVWNIRHIQFDFDEEKGEEAALQKSQTVGQLLTTTDFCDLVDQFSDDTASAPRCGRYSFGTGQMLPEIEQEVSNMEANDIRIVKSARGYHILHLESFVPSREASFEEVSEAISNLISSQRRQGAFDGFLNGLRENADIVSYIS